MRLTTAMHKGELWWKAEFTNYMPFWIGRVRRLPTFFDAMRIVDAWKLKVIDGRPYHFDTFRQVWVAYGVSCI
jgi:hypothetical protein